MEIINFVEKKSENIEIIFFCRFMYISFGRLSNVLIANLLSFFPLFTEKYHDKFSSNSILSTALYMKNVNKTKYYANQEEKIHFNLRRTVDSRDFHV